MNPCPPGTFPVRLVANARLPHEVAPEEVTLVDWIVTAIERTGYLGVFLLMLIDNVFPPIPSEIIMPLAGLAAARGQLSLVGVFLAGTVWSLSGALVWYAVGRWLGRERLTRFAARHGRWLTMSPAEVERTSIWFARRGGITVLVGRVIPGVRSLISVPAGVSGMPLAPFLAYSTAGTIVWTGLLAAAGYVLGENYRTVAGFIEPIGNGVLVLALALYLYRVATFARRSSVLDRVRPSSGKREWAGGDTVRRSSRETLSDPGCRRCNSHPPRLSRYCSLPLNHRSL